MSDFEVKIWRVFAALVGIVLIVWLIIATFTSCSPLGRAAYNANRCAVQKVDDATSYKTKKTVEDTCRSMIANYESDRLAYEQYKDSDSEEMRTVANKAKIRANTTASEYNNYVLKNNYVWRGNVPKDIDTKLDYLE